MGQHGGQVHCGVGRGDTEPSGLPHCMSNAGSLEQRLAGYAAGPGAVAAQPVTLNQRNLLTQPGGKTGGGKPSGTPADDYQVVSLSHGLPAGRLRAGSRLEALDGLGRMFRCRAAVGLDQSPRVIHSPGARVLRPTHPRTSGPRPAGGLPERAAPPVALPAADRRR